MSQSQIDREFNAQFTDDSAGYFKISKMADCTIVDGESPAVEVAGDIDAEYIMAFDPSWSESEASDDFAIQVIKLLPEEKKGVLVHSYALPGTNLKKHINYFKYILDHFNKWLYPTSIAQGVYVAVISRPGFLSSFINTQKTRYLGKRLKTSITPS